MHIRIQNPAETQRVWGGGAVTLIGFAEIIPINTKPVLLNSFVETEKSKQLFFIVL